MDTLSNTARFYLSRFEEVCRLFEKIESDGWEEPCFDLLSDERLPLARRVVLHYFAAFSDASEPDVHLRQGREVIKSIDKMIESGVMGPLPWLAKQKEAYDELEATLELEDADNLSEGDNLVEALSATLIGTEMSDDDIMTDTPETMNAMSIFMPIQYSL